MLCSGVQYATHWELSSLRMRSATLSAENEALRSHVSQLQEQVALLCEDLQVSVHSQQATWQRQACAA